MRKWALAIAIVCLVGAARGATPPELPNIDSCLGRLDPELDIGYERIAARCPELIRQLERGSWVPWLPQGWKEPGNDLSAGSLREFRELVIREETSGAAGRAPDVRALKSVLNGLAGKADQGWWSRFKSWLRSILERRAQTPEESWFDRMVAHVGLSQSLRQLVAYAALGAVVVLAAVIVLNELRTAALLTRRRASRRREDIMRRATLQEPWSDIERRPLLEKPRVLLELIVRRLAERGYLPPAGALTIRELTRVARLPQPEDRARLWELAAAAERVRYSAEKPTPAALEESVVHGRELLNRLDVGAS